MPLSDVDRSGAFPLLLLLSVRIAIDMSEGGRRLVFLPFALLSPRSGSETFEYGWLPSSPRCLLLFPRIENWPFEGDWLLFWPLTLPPFPQSDNSTFGGDLLPSWPKTLPVSSQRELVIRRRFASLLAEASSSVSSQREPDIRRRLVSRLEAESSSVSSERERQRSETVSFSSGG